MRDILNKKLLVLCVAIPLLVGGIAAFFTKDAMAMFTQLDKPPLSPPGWLFPVVWTILYTLMGISSYLIANSKRPTEDKTRALSVYAASLFVNFLWSFFFFNMEWYFFSFLWLLLLWSLIIVMIIEYWGINKTAALLTIPYLLWVTFAGYLNFGIWWLN